MPKAASKPKVSSTRIAQLEKDVIVLEGKVQTKLLKVVDKMTELGLREYTKYLSSPGRVFWMNLFAGIARGFGFFLGATVVVALVTYLLTQVLGQIPIFADGIAWLEQALDPSNLRTIRSLEFLQEAPTDGAEVVSPTQ